MKSLILIDKDEACKLLIGIGRNILDAKVPFENQSNAIENLADLAWTIGGVNMTSRVEKSVWADYWKEEAK